MIWWKTYKIKHDFYYLFTGVKSGNSGKDALDAFLFRCWDELLYDIPFCQKYCGWYCIYLQIFRRKPLKGFKSGGPLNGYKLVVSIFTVYNLLSGPYNKLTVKLVLWKYWHQLNALTNLDLYPIIIRRWLHCRVRATSQRRLRVKT